MLNGKNILITAGPVWVPLDRVRVITNIFSGELGVTIAKVLPKKELKLLFVLAQGESILLKIIKILRLFGSDIIKRF